MNESTFRSLFRKAIGEASYPAGLSNRVGARVDADRHARFMPLRRPRPWLVGLGRAGSLAGALVALVLIAALMLGVHVWVISTRPTAPVQRDPSIKQYQTMLRVDDQRLIDSPSACSSIDDGACPADAAVVIAAVQTWLDDLNRSKPPARFAVVHGEMRRHLALAISDMTALVAAYRLKDQNGMSRAGTAAVAEYFSLATEAADIIYSSQGTIATYNAEVGYDKSSLLACVLCRQLIGQNQVSCQTSQTPSCVDEIAATRWQLEAFQGDLVHVYNPDSLAAKDARLKADLLSATVALDAMASAVSAGDQVGLQVGRDVLRVALGKVDSDAANIIQGL